LNYQKSKMASGLYFVATPIGTARDITLRALDVLASADVLAAEDTRSLRKLMEIHGVPLSGRSIVAYHDHSGPGARARLLEAMAAGQSVAYASEAGMPLIADPGFDLGRAAAEAGHLVTCAPGASALTTALALGGLPTDTVLFAGFLPSSSGARRKRLEELSGIPGTLVFYESPKRIAACLRDAADVLGASRQAALCRELTKKFEEIRRLPLSELVESVADSPPKGEIVLLVDAQRSSPVNQSDIDQMLKDALKDMSVRDAADMVAEATGMKRREVYQKALAMGRDG